MIRERMIDLNFWDYKIDSQISILADKSRSKEYVKHAKSIVLPYGEVSEYSFFYKEGDDFEFLNFHKSKKVDRSYLYLFIEPYMIFRDKAEENRRKNVSGYNTVLLLDKFCKTFKEVCGSELYSIIYCYGKNNRNLKYITIKALDVKFILRVEFFKEKSEVNKKKIGVSDKKAAAVSGGDML